MKKFGVKISKNYHYLNQFNQLRKGKIRKIKYFKSEKDRENFITNMTKKLTEWQIRDKSVRYEKI